MVATTVAALIAAEALGGLVATLAGLSLWRSFRLVGSRSLGRLSTGFFLLAASQFAALGLDLLVATAGTDIPLGRFDAFDLAFWLQYGTLIVGLVAVFRSFGRHPFRWTPALAPILLPAGPLLELVVIVLLFFVVLHAGLNHIARRAKGSVLVAVGFFFLFAAHTLNLVGYTALNPRWWFAECVNLVGLLILLYAVGRPRGRPDA